MGYNPQLSLSEKKPNEAGLPLNAGKAVRVV